MKKQFLLGIVAGAMLVSSVAIVGSAWWQQTSWPYKAHYVSLDVAKPSSATLCEVYTATGVATRSVPNGHTDAAGHIENCLLRMTGEVREDGSFKPVLRPANPMNIIAWQHAKDFAALKKSHIRGVCSESDFLFGLGGAPTKGDCKTLIDAELPFRGVPGR